MREIIHGYPPEHHWPPVDDDTAVMKHRCDACWMAEDGAGEVPTTLAWLKSALRGNILGGRSSPSERLLQDAPCVCLPTEDLPPDLCVSPQLLWSHTYVRVLCSFPVSPRQG